MRKDKNKLINKKVKRAFLRNRVKDGRRLPSRQGERSDADASGSREKRVRAEGDSHRVYKGIRVGPLRRFLSGRVGQAWDLVYAELCESLRADQVGRTVVDQWIRSGLVHLKVQMIEGLPWTISPMRARLNEGEFYVCPDSGRLKQHSRHSRLRKKRNRA
jgi:hypothetical protein